MKISPTKVIQAQCADIRLNRYEDVKEIGLDLYSKLSLDKFVCSNLTLDNAKELVAELIEAIEAFEGEPF